MLRQCGWCIGIYEKIGIEREAIEIILLFFLASTPLRPLRIHKKGTLKQLGSMMNDEKDIFIRTIFEKPVGPVRPLFSDILMAAQLL